MVNRPGSVGDGDDRQLIVGMRRAATRGGARLQAPLSNTGTQAEMEHVQARRWHLGGLRATTARSGNSAPGDQSPRRLTRRLRRSPPPFTSHLHNTRPTHGWSDGRPLVLSACAPRPPAPRRLRYPCFLLFAIVRSRVARTAARALAAHNGLHALRAAEGDAARAQRACGPPSAAVPAQVCVAWWRARVRRARASGALVLYGSWLHGSCPKWQLASANHPAPLQTAWSAWTTPRASNTRSRACCTPRGSCAVSAAGRGPCDGSLWRSRVTREGSLGAPPPLLSPRRAVPLIAMNAIIIVVELLVG
jgi:hypothetical protein